jgi:hypothetical protein
LTDEHSRGEPTGFAWRRIADADAGERTVTARREKGESNRETPQQDSALQVWCEQEDVITAA